MNGWMLGWIEYVTWMHAIFLLSFENDKINWFGLSIFFSSRQLYYFLLSVCSTCIRLMFKIFSRFQPQITSSNNAKYMHTNAFFCSHQVWQGTFSDGYIQSAVSSIRSLTYTNYPIDFILEFIVFNSFIISHEFWYEFCKKVLMSNWRIFYFQNFTLLNVLSNSIFHTLLSFLSYFIKFYRWSSD